MRTASRPTHPAPHAARLTVVPALDGLRAVAVTLVLLFHAGHLDGGFLGVDLFFALSGYLITSLLLLDPAPSLRAFWARRVRRLLPGVVLMLAGTLVAIAVLHGADDVRANRDEALASLVYLSNWRALAVPATYLTIFQHTWSLSIEAQFYVVWPLIVAGARRIGRPSPAGRDRRVLALSVAGAAASTAAMIALHDGADSIARVYFGTDTRATPILLGAAVAAAARLGLLARLPAAAGSVAGGVAFVGVAAFVVLVRRPDAALYEGGYAAFSVFAAVLVASLLASRGPLATVLAVGPLRRLGVISYGVYLWHWPVFYLLNAERAHVAGWPLFALQSAVTVAVATASFHLIEEPVRRGGDTLARPVG